MRIIAGAMKGRRLKAVPGRTTRPTADKVKGAIFNVLQDKLVDAVVLDLFAGTGNLGLEALSRGAVQAVLVEKDASAQRIIEENLRNAQAEGRARLFRMDAFAYLSRDQETSFDIIFLDPPYRQGLVEKALAALASPCRLTDRGVIIAETARDEVLERVSCFEVRKTAEYGDTKIWYLQRAGE